jgi:hypothetical protein
MLFACSPELFVELLPWAQESAQNSPPIPEDELLTPADRRWTEPSDLYRSHRAPVHTTALIESPKSKAHAACLERFCGC